MISTKILTKKEVEKVAKLARLGLSEKEIVKFQKELSLVLDYFNLLKEVGVVKIEPTSHSIEIKNVIREDETKKESLERIDKLSQMAPEKKDGYFKVKAIL